MWKIISGISLCVFCFGFVAAFIDVVYQQNVTQERVTAFWLIVFYMFSIGCMLIVLGIRASERRISMKANINIALAIIITNVVVALLTFFNRHAIDDYGIAVLYLGTGFLIAKGLAMIHDCE